MRLRLCLMALFGILTSSTGSGQQRNAFRFEITVPASSNAEPITGRVYVLISRNADREPRTQINQTGVPIFGRDVEKLSAGQAAVIDETDLGAPLKSIREIPAGDYYVQALVNVYSEFKRADGHVVWMHDDQWEGQKFASSPGNLYSEVQRLTVDPARSGAIRLTASKVIPPVQIPPDTEWVKRFKFQSPMLTKFWGRPIYIGATALLPRDYARETTYYPVIYQQGHFGLNPPYGFQPGNAMYEEWMKDNFPRMIVVTFQHPNPYFDDSYAVNSVNVGPYGDAIMQELIPEVEKRYRIIRQPYARVLTGGSTGGWEALALQIFHPDFFGGTFADCPDPVDFRNVEGINIYEDVNAFHKTHEWRTVFTPNIRATDGQVQLTSEQKNHFELVAGTHGRSGFQMDIWSAVYGPIGKDGFYEPLYDKFTGVINPNAAKYWRDNYDLRYILERDWPALGPKLFGKIHVFAGTSDTYHLNNAAKLLQESMRKTQNPHDPGYFLWGDEKPHCWGGPVATPERLKQFAQYIMSRKPDDATTYSWWHY